MNNFFLSFGRLFPLSLKNTLKNVYGFFPMHIRYGKDFMEFFNFLQESQWWSREQFEEYQLDNLNNLLGYAYENVPYYRKVFQQNGMKPNDIQDFNDLKEFPCLTKEEFRSNFQDIVSKKVIRQNLTKISTSGTTGKPLQLFTNKEIESKEMAAIFHQWARVGFSPDDKRIQMRGNIISNSNLIEYDPIFKILRLSPRIVDLKTANYYLKKINEYKSKFIHGYPSVIVNFARILRKNNINIPFKLQAVLFASETVYDWEREIVSDVFRCKVFSHYGMTEKSVLAAECENSHNYHCMPQYGITEIDDKTKEIIGTGFLNYITPLIRYKTTDIASISSGKCRSCEREYYPIFKDIEGRIEDMIVTSKGFIAPALMTHPFKNLKSIENTQIVQESGKSIILRVETFDKNKSSFKSEICGLIHDLNEILGYDVDITVKIVDEIEKSKSGKFRWIISNIPNKSIEDEFDL